MTLQSEDMGKLVAGKSAIWHPQHGLATYQPTDEHGLVGEWSLIGTLTPDGWIEGEWAENPVGDMEVFARPKIAASKRGQKLSAKSIVWPRVGSFRPAHREAQPETDGGGESDGMSDLEWAVYTAAYSILRDYENHPLKDRGLINAGDQRIPKLIAAQVVEQMAALASKGV